MLKQETHKPLYNVLYCVNVCNVNTRLRNLKSHIRTLLEKVKYPGNQCEYKATSKVNLKNPEKFKHNGMNL